MFAKHSWYFRNALVRANYRNIQKGIDYSPIYLVRFFMLAKNVRSQIDQCSEYLCMIHANDNGGVYNEKQMPFTFTRGRGNLITDWYHIIGALIKIEFSGWMIFDNSGTFARVPEVLQTQYMRMLHAIVKEWQGQFTFVEEC